VSPSQKEKHRLLMQEWRRQNPEKARARQRAMWAKHREKRLEEARQYRETHKEEIARSKAEWRKKNRERVRSHQAARRARKKAAQVGPPCPRIQALYFIARWLRDRGDDVQVDHIIPLAKGGPHVYENLQILPATENKSKGARLP
jgi:5-methylcytosine-specific restriction endonuclease McrA